MITICIFSGIYSIWYSEVLQIPTYWYYTVVLLKVIQWLFYVWCTGVTANLSIGFSTVSREILMSSS